MTSERINEYSTTLNVAPTISKVDEKISDNDQDDLDIKEKYIYLTGLNPDKYGSHGKYRKLSTTEMKSDILDIEGEGIKDKYDQMSWRELADTWFTRATQSGRMVSIPDPRRQTRSALIDWLRRNDPEGLQIENRYIYLTGLYPGFHVSLSIHEMNDKIKRIEGNGVKDKYDEMSWKDLANEWEKVMAIPVGRVNPKKETREFLIDNLRKTT